jgi:hypothetical protein
MIRFKRTALMTALLGFSFANTALPQTGPDPFAHWAGTIFAPFGEVKIEIDLAKDENGKLTGTFAAPDQHLKGFPLSDVKVSGDLITFAVVSSGGGTFDGILSADGKSLNGAFNAAAGSVPFNLSRDGAAHVETAPKNARFDKDLEGTWNGALEGAHGRLRLVLKMVNQPDGTSVGRIVSVDEGGYELPVAITRNAAEIAFEIKATGGTWSGKLDPAKDEMAGTYHQADMTLPLNFHRSSEMK